MNAHHENLIVTNIRLPRRELRRYRRLARQHGMSLNTVLWTLLTQATHQLKTRGTVDVTQLVLDRPREHEPIWEVTLS